MDEVGRGLELLLLLVLPLLELEHMLPLLLSLLLHLLLEGVRERFLWAANPGCGEDIGEKNLPQLQLQSKAGAFHSRLQGSGRCVWQPKVGTLRHRKQKCTDQSQC